MSHSDRTVIKLTMRQWYTFRSDVNNTLAIIDQSFDKSGNAISVACCGIGSIVKWHLSKQYIVQYILVNSKPVEPRPTLSELVGLLQIHYPDDFDWLLWHPEILKGIYND